MRFNKTSMRDTNQFNIGETLKLKSGGPRMTVTYVLDSSTGPPKVQCHWFPDGAAKASFEAFPETALYLITSSKDGES